MSNSGDIGGRNWAEIVERALEMNSNRAKSISVDETA
jgi:hypothetical protein